MRQHLIEVAYQDATMVPDQPELTVLAGDLVLWHSRDAARLPFAVVGEKDFFDSHRLVNECGFSHAFAVAGEYHWRDAFGSGLQGVVRVSDPKGSGERDLRAWQKRLTQGTLVMIKDGAAEPAEIDIVTGQTVYFAVVTGPGISVTDSRILAGRPT